MRRYAIIGGSHDEVLKVAKKLQAAHRDAQLQFCYEAGPRGFPLCRFLQGHGFVCIIVCPSKVPRKPEDRVKTDRRDADQLARLYRAGELSGIFVPDYLAIVFADGKPDWEPPKPSPPWLTNWPESSGT